MIGTDKPILVTGASGFVGCCAARRLLAEGSQVHVVLRPGTDTWRLQEVLDRLRVHRLDLCDGESVSAVLQEVRPRVVVHLATHGAYERQDDAPEILRTDILGSYHLLEASRAAGVEVFVNAGSSSEYGYKKDVMTETDVLEPNSVYAVAKAAQTHLASLVGRGGGMAVVTFRLFSVYGPWEEPARLLPTLLRRAKAGLALEMAAPETAHDFVYVDDVLEAMLDFGRLRDLRGEVLNLGTGVQTTLREVVAVVQDVVGKRSEVRWGAHPARRWDTYRWQADISRARQVLGWHPRHSLGEGVRAMSEWMDGVGARYAHA